MGGTIAMKTTPQFSPEKDNRAWKQVYHYYESWHWPRTDDGILRTMWDMHRINWIRIVKRESRISIETRKHSPGHQSPGAWIEAPQPPNITSFAFNIAGWVLSGHNSWQTNWIRHHHIHPDHASLREEFCAAVAVWNHRGCDFFVGTGKSKAMEAIHRRRRVSQQGLLPEFKRYVCLLWCFRGGLNDPFTHIGMFDARAVSLLPLGNTILS